MTGDDPNNDFCNGNANSDSGDDRSKLLFFKNFYVVIFSVLFFSGPGLSRWYNSILSTYLQYCSWLVQRQVCFWQLEIFLTL